MINIKIQSNIQSFDQKNKDRSKLTIVVSKIQDHMREKVGEKLIDEVKMMSVKYTLGV